MLGWSSVLALACSAGGAREEDGEGSGGAGAQGGGAGTIGNPDGGGMDFTGCASDVKDGTLLPLDMYIMLDRSGSMRSDGVDYWGPVTQAISTFVQHPDAEGISVGLGYFPVRARTPLPVRCTNHQQCGIYGPCVAGFNVCEGAMGGEQNSCEWSDYRVPPVPIAELPAGASAIVQSLNATAPEGGTTPTTPALQGALSYAQAWAQEHPDHITLVVLASDGAPNTCVGNSTQAAANLAAKALTETPSIPTFVIGIGNVSALHQIAQAGGTQQALIVSGSDPGQEFLDAMNEIRGAMGCQFKLPPPPPGETLEPSRVNVAFTPTGGQRAALAQVAGAGSCMGGPGWYYDNPANPTKILLCPASCDYVKHGQVRVEIVMGCKTIIN